MGSLLAIFVGWINIPWGKTRWIGWGDGVESFLESAGMTWLVLLVISLAFLAVGFLGRRRIKSRSDVTELMIANRHLPLGLAWISLAATWIGGGYVNGTAEAVYDPGRGLVWCQAPWCYALSLVVGGLLFAGPMRRREYRTMLDLFDDRYGKRMASFLYLPALVGDLFWTAAILSALGATLGTLFGIDPALVVLVAATVVVTYTVMGGLWSVAFSDVLQFVCICVGLSIALPFVIHQCGGLTEMWRDYQAVYGTKARLIPDANAWTQPDPWGWQWVDAALLLICGGIPWQVYFQRVLATANARSAQVMSVTAGLACLLVALIPMLIGMGGACLDWNALAVEEPSDAAIILPYLLRHGVPSVVSLIGLTAIAAAVMSSVDSSILSSASMFAWNVYRPWIGHNKQDARLQLVLRVAIVVIGAVAATLALRVDSVYQLWYFCADLVYVVLFPQLVIALFYQRSTAVAAALGAALALSLRGVMYVAESGFAPASLEALNEAVGWLPWKTLIMLVSLATIAVVSQVTQETGKQRGTDES